MSKKKHPEHVNHERWLVSYADFITLLFAFFVVLFASGQADKKKQAKFASAFNQAFSQMAIFDPASKKPALSDSTGNNPNAEPKPIELPLQVDATGDSPRMEGNLSARSDDRIFKPQELQSHLESVLQQQQDHGSLRSTDFKIRPTPEGLTLSLHEGGFFDSGSADLRPAALATLQALAEALPPGNLRIEGHTDNVPIRSTDYADNWALSSARALTIARYLLTHSLLSPQQVSIAGYAEFHPVASNSTPEGRAQNRRVDIVFLQPPPQTATAATTPAAAQPTQPLRPPR